LEVQQSSGDDRHSTAAGGRASFHQQKTSETFRIIGSQCRCASAQPHQHPRDRPPYRDKRVALQVDRLQVIGMGKRMYLPSVCGKPHVENSRALLH
jgi:hypothetical protein